MGIGDTQELVLICKIEGKLTAFGDRREINHQFYDEYSYLDGEVVDGLQVVEITVIDKSTQATLKRKFKVWKDRREFCISEL